MGSLKWNFVLNGQGKAVLAFFGTYPSNLQDQEDFGITDFAFRSVWSSRSRKRPKLPFPGHLGQNFTSKTPLFIEFYMEMDFQKNFKILIYLIQRLAEIYPNFDVRYLRNLGILPEYFFLKWKIHSRTINGELNWNFGPQQFCRRPLKETTKKSKKGRFLQKILIKTRNFFLPPIDP